MTMLADRIDAVIGVDTHKASHTAAVVTPTGGAMAHLAVPRTPSAPSASWPSLVDVPLTVGSGRSRARAVSVPGSRPTCSSRASGSSRSTARGDPPVATAPRATSSTRSALPARRSTRVPRPATATWRPEALRVLLATRQAAVVERTRAVSALQALVVNAPEALRGRFRHLGTHALVLRCARLRIGHAQSVEHRATISALRSTARRALACEAEAADLEAALEVIVQQERPELLAEPGVGVITAAAILNAWSHAGRIRSEAAFAMLAGVAPIPASSGRGPPSTQPRRRPSAQPSAAHDRALGTHPTIRRPGPMPRVAERRAGATGRSSAVSSGSSHGGSSGSSRTAPKRLDRHRSIRAVSAACGAEEGGGCSRRPTSPRAQRRKPD